MDPKEISSLAKLLRDSGDKVLNHNFKLTLSGQILRALNDSFSLIADQNEICAPQSFQVVKPNNSKSDVFRDLQFIHDFVQKTKTLCVNQFHNDEPFDGEIDISKFRNLQKLEVQRVPIGQITGIQQMRAHLHELACIRSIANVTDIISHCGGDKSNGFIWNELKFADFSYNLLDSIDCSLEFAPLLQHLNLSHNHLVSVDAIKWLPNLKQLDLSFNHLTHIPLFHMEATRRLKVLVLNNNFIEDLSGISRLDALNVLDLSRNCLLDHSTLLPLSTLIALQYLNILGNSLSCHPKHRVATARYLHKNTSTVKFVLDNEPLSKAEKSLTGQYQSYSSILTSRISTGSSFTVHSKSDSRTASTRTLENTPSSSVGSNKSFQLGDSQASNSNQDEMIASTSTIQKRRKARQAIIAEDIDSDLTTNKPSTGHIVSLEGNKDHLETKKQIENLRKQHGTSWLHNHGEKLGHNSSSIDADPLSGKQRLTSEEIIDSLFERMSPVAPVPELLSNTVEQSFTSKDKSNSNPFENEESSISDTSIEKSETTLYKTVSEGETPIQETATTDYESVLDDSIQLSNIYPNTDAIEAFSEEEENEKTYIVEIQPSKEEILLVVSDISIKEKDPLTARTKTKWNLKTLESCERSKSEVLQLSFDTVKKDKKHRIYIVEPGLGQELEKYLRSILAKRPLSEMNQTLYRCAKCTMQFSRENSAKKQNTDVFCPACKSSYVIEIKEQRRSQSMERTPSLLPSAVKMVCAKAVEVFVERSKNPIENCESHSSIGSATSLNESSSCSKISKSGSSFDSNQSVAGSSNCDRDADFQNRNGESDVEILSNPSQSSIEVLDCIQTSRKHSEERRLSQLPSLDTITNDMNRLAASLVHQQTSTNDLLALDALSVGSIVKNSIGGDNEEEKKTILNQINLTESSSSGSVTDSICTAYEQNHGNDLPAAGIDRNKFGIASPEKTTATKSDSSVISTMLGGLFLSTNLLMSRSQHNEAATNGARCDTYKFSYTDFDNVDHRIKLFLYQNIFEDDNEHLKWLVKGYIYLENAIEQAATNFSSIFVMSTTKFYVLQILGQESNDVSKWVKRYMAGTVDRLEMVRVLPWKIGVTFTIKGIGNLHLFSQDILRTDSLLLFFANNPLPDTCSLEYQISEKLSHKLLKATNNAQLKMLAILNECDVTTDNLQNTQQMVGLIITETDLYLMAPTHRWITASDRVDADIDCYQQQMMSNLVEIENLNDHTLQINFVDESQDNKCELWTCTFETESSAASTLNAISQSWERLFGVPLGNN